MCGTLGEGGRVLGVYRTLNSICGTLGGGGNGLGFTGLQIVYVGHGVEVVGV